MNRLGAIAVLFVLLERHTSMACFWVECTVDISWSVIRNLIRLSVHCNKKYLLNAAFSLGITSLYFGNLIGTNATRSKILC
jgi:hypothetical protein